jgi:hypothetical protein
VPAFAIPAQARGTHVSEPHATFAGLFPPFGHGHGSLEAAETARDRAMSHLRDAEHWRRLVAARLDLAVAAVADIDDLEATLIELRPLIGMPGADGRLAESSLLIRLRAALAELDRYIASAQSQLDHATAHVADCIVTEAALEQASREVNTGAV